MKPMNQSRKLMRGPNVAFSPLQIEDCPGLLPIGRAKYVATNVIGCFGGKLSHWLKGDALNSSSEMGIILANVLPGPLCAEMVHLGLFEKEWSGAE